MSYVLTSGKYEGSDVSVLSDEELLVARIPGWSRKPWINAADIAAVADEQRRRRQAEWKRRMSARSASFRQAVRV